MNGSPPYRVLVFPGGTEIGLEIQAALRYCKDIQLLSAGTPAPSHAPYVFEHHHPLPSIFDAGWLAELQALIARERIGFVYPAYDDIQLALMEHAAEIGAAIVSPPLDVCRRTRSKKQTYELFRDVLRVPQLYSAADAPVFPVFVKPDRGQGAQGTSLCRTPASLDMAVAAAPGMLVCEYLPGEEATVDCFSSKQAGLQFCRGRRRSRVRHGISVCSEALDDPLFRRWAEIIQSRLELRGAWFFQVKRDAAGQWTLLEIGPRVAGAMAFHRVRGVNFPLLTIYEQLGMPVRILENDLPCVLDRALTNRYALELEFETAYVDFDDTLVCKERLNLDLVHFLFQCVDRGKKLVLLTRHRGDIRLALRKLRMETLFDEVVEVPVASKKSAYIADRRAIFIDDSFAERVDVAERTGIPTFDSSMLEVLLDHRR